MTLTYPTKYHTVRILISILLIFNKGVTCSVVWCKAININRYIKMNTKRVYGMDVDRLNW